MSINVLGQCFPKSFARGPLLASKNNHRSSVLAHVHIERPDDWYPKLKMYISELIFDRYECLTVDDVKMHSMICR